MPRNETEQYLLDVVIADKVLQLMADRAALAEFVAEGFKGFVAMTLPELLQCAEDAGLPARDPRIAAAMQTLQRQQSERALRLKADLLDAAGTLVHGSAFQPLHQAVQRLLALANLPAEQRRPHPDDASLIRELRHFANTVGRPASQRMVDAASVLEALSPTMPNPSVPAAPAT